MTDPIADMLTRHPQRGDGQAHPCGHARQQAEGGDRADSAGRGLHPGLPLVEEPAERAGRQPRQVIRVFLKYGPHGEKVISGIERISRPGRRVYLGVEDVPVVLGGLGHEHPDDVARRDDGPRRPEGGRGRGSAL